AQVRTLADVDELARPGRAAVDERGRGPIGDAVVGIAEREPERVLPSILGWRRRASAARREQHEDREQQRKRATAISRAKLEQGRTLLAALDELPSPAPRERCEAGLVN